PDGKTIYVANYRGPTLFGSVSLYNIAADGSIAAKLPDVDAGKGSWGVAVSPDGKSVYVTNSGTDNSISQFDRASDGSLTPKSPASQSDGTSPENMWLSPDGKNAYVSDYGTYQSTTMNKDFALGQFDVGGGGLLSKKSPPTLATDDYPWGVVVTPDQGPTASFTDPPSGGFAESFDATASSDPDGSLAHYI